jgi:hypothetical protein
MHAPGRLPGHDAACAAWLRAGAVAHERRRHPRAGGGGSSRRGECWDGREMGRLAVLVAGSVSGASQSSMRPVWTEIDLCDICSCSACS